MSLGRGEDVVIAENVLGLWVLWGCAKSCEFVTNTDSVETSVSGSGKSATFLPTKASASGSLDGLTKYNGVGIISLPELRQRQMAGTILSLRIQRTALDGSIYSDVFSCFIESVSDQGALDGMNTFNVAFKVTGLVTQSFTSIPILGNVKRFEYTGIAGELSFTAVKNSVGATISLIGKTVLGLEVDGIGFSKMIITGTPIDKQFKFISATGTLTVPVPMDAGVEAFGYYI